MIGPHPGTTSHGKYRATYFCMFGLVYKHNFHQYLYNSPNTSSIGMVGPDSGITNCGKQNKTYFDMFGLVVYNQNL